MIWIGNRSGRNNGRAVVVAPKRRISDEASVCSRRSCGNHDPDIPGHFVCAEHRWISRRLIGRQQQRQRRRLAERRRCRRRLSRHQRCPSRTRRPRRIEQCRRRSKRRSERLQACIAARSGYQHFRHGAVVRRWRQHRQRCDHGLGKIGEIRNGYDGPAKERRCRDHRRKQGG